MKRAFIVVLSISLLFTALFFVFFASNFERRQKGIGYEYFKSTYFGTSFALSFNNGSVSVPYQFNFGRGEYVSNEILNGKFMVGTNIDVTKYFYDSSVPGGSASERFETDIYISHLTSENIAVPPETVRHWTKPFIKLKAYGYLYAFSEQHYDWIFQVERIDVILNSEFFTGVISNNLTIFQKSLISIDSISNGFDFVGYFADLLKEIFIFISNVVKDGMRLLS